MALLALLVTLGLQLVVISVDFLIVVKFLPLSNKQLRDASKALIGLSMHSGKDRDRLPKTDSCLRRDDDISTSLMHYQQLRTHGKNFQGSHFSGTAPESCLVNHEADTSIFHKHHKGLGAVPHLFRCLPVLSRWPVTVMAAPRSPSAASTLALSRWCLIFTGAVTGTGCPQSPCPATG